MTYNVRPRTFRVYCEMLPMLTEVQKTVLERELLRGRNEAIIAGGSNEKHEQFRLAKGRIGNFLSQQGYDLKTAQEKWAKKQQEKP
jgi:hypothetical protein